MFFLVSPFKILVSNCPGSTTQEKDGSEKFLNELDKLIKEGNQEMAL